MSNNLGQSKYIHLLDSQTPMRFRFVRHAFGNYFDILKEVTYHPLVSKFCHFSPILELFLQCQSVFMIADGRNVNIHRGRGKPMCFGANKRSLSFHLTMNSVETASLEYWLCMDQEGHPAES